MNWSLGEESWSGLKFGLEIEEDFGVEFEVTFEVESWTQWSVQLS